MSKFSEALRKIEENRTQRDLYNLERSYHRIDRREKVRKWFGYLVFAVGILLILFSFIYDFGFNKVIQPSEPSKTAASVVQQMPSPVREVVPSENEPAPELMPQTAVPSRESLIARSALSEADMSSGPSQTPPAEAAIPVPSVPAAAKDAFYTIQLVTYQNKDLADKEVERLAKKGLRAFNLQSKKYFTVCVEEFKTNAEASKKLGQLKTSLGAKDYKDAFIRFVKAS